jgi:hypothetical protein
MKYDSQLSAPCPRGARSDGPHSRHVIPNNSYFFLNKDTKRGFFGIRLDPERHTGVRSAKPPDLSPPQANFGQDTYLASGVGIPIKFSIPYFLKDLKILSFTRNAKYQGS